MYTHISHVYAQMRTRLYARVRNATKRAKKRFAAAHPLKFRSIIQQEIGFVFDAQLIRYIFQLLFPEIITGHFL